MSAAKLAGSLAAVLTTITLGTMAGHAEEVKPIFERAIPNIPGKSLVALVLRSTVEFGGRSGGPSSENWRLSLAQTLSGSRRLLDKEYPRSEVASKHQQS